MIWLLRLLLALALLFGVEILFWNDPAARPLLDWPLQLTGYIALSAMLLDLWARWRVREIFGLLALAGLFSLLMSAALNPAAAFVDLPRTLVTRMMGIYTAAGLLALLLFAALLAGRVRPPLLIAPLAGVLWGIWGRWLPVITGAAAAPDLPLLLTAGALVLALIVLAALLAQRAPAEADSLLLPPLLWALAMLVLALLALRTPLDPLPLVIALVLAAYNALILWFQAPARGGSLLTLPPTHLSLLPILGAAALFLIGGAAGYNLHISANSPLFDLPLGVFGAFGLVWLPAVSVVLGVRGYRRQTRQRRL